MTVTATKIRAYRYSATPVGGDPDKYLLRTFARVRSRARGVGRRAAGVGSRLTPWR